MKEYELVREIFNKCANNQMRDVFFEELELESPEAYMEELLRDKQADVERSVAADGSVLYDVNIAGLRQRFTFTEL